MGFRCDASRVNRWGTGPPRPCLFWPSPIPHVATGDDSLGPISFFSPSLRACQEPGVHWSSTGPGNTSGVWLRIVWDGAPVDPRRSVGDIETGPQCLRPPWPSPVQSYKSRVLSPIRQAKSPRLTSQWGGQARQARAPTLTRTQSWDAVPGRRSRGRLVLSVALEHQGEVRAFGPLGLSCT